MIPYALFNSKIVFEPFQYKPFFEFFENTKEDLYIADEVGVGKTIEAGIIVSELINADRNATWVKESLEDVNFPRILILAPPALCAQWKEELEDKFMLDVYDSYSSGLGINHNAQITVVAESWQQLAKIEDDNMMYDLLIVDEVHNFRNQYTEDPFTNERKESRRYKSLVKICEKARRKVFMSATPIFNKAKDLKNETDLLSENYNITSSTKSVSKCLDFQPRIESVLIDLNPAELELYDVISGIGAINPLTKSAVYLHEGCSSMPCLAKTLTEAPAKFIREAFLDAELSVDGFYQEQMDKIIKLIEEGNEQGIVYFRENTNDPEIRMILNTYLMKEKLSSYGEKYLAEKDKYAESKLVQLDNIIENKLVNENGYKMHKKHIVIFAHYIETCNYVYDHLRTICSDEVPVFIATGENTKQEIDRYIEEFKQTCRDDIFDSFIVCSDVCREGKNMQECQALINFDLPFSPSIMQQRIGRIDRNGQKHTPLVFNLVCNIYNDIHTYYEIIFQKIRIINGISSICGIDVLRETNEQIQIQVLEEWKKETYKNYHDKDNEYTELQNGYLRYLRGEKRRNKGTSRKDFDEEIKLVSTYSDDEIMEKMSFILFNAPNDELKMIRENAHCEGKRFIATKLFSEYRESNMLRPHFVEYIQNKVRAFVEAGILEYDNQLDVYSFNLENIKEDFTRYIIERQLFKHFASIEDVDGRFGTPDMYFDISDIAFVSAIYKEVGNDSEQNGRSLNQFAADIEQEYVDCYVSLDPLCEALAYCISG